MEVRNFFQQMWHSQVKSTWFGRKTAAIRAVVVEKNVRCQMWTDGWLFGFIYTIQEFILTLSLTWFYMVKNLVFAIKILSICYKFMFHIKIH